EKNCLNFPLRANCGDETYLKTLEEALNKVDMEKVEVIAVSAGFDAHAGDLASLGLTEKCYEEIGKMIAKLNKHTFFVLEGGYSGEKVGKDIDAVLRAFNP
ncbi:histone deacetylase, partial [Candidatus Bathyarchaeota archaeon]